MKNQYVGDIGDYGKLGLLRFLLQHYDFKLGVNWYLTPNDNTSDGRHTQYLDTILETPDAQLHAELNKIVKTEQRHIAALETNSILPNAVFYNDILGFSKNQTGLELQKLRLEWHKNALQKLHGCNLIFLDPDNGLETASTKPHHLKGNKYTSYREAGDFFNAGASVIIYNHRDRKPEHEYIERFKVFEKMELASEVKLLCLTFSKISTRDYLFLMQAKHSAKIKQVVDLMLETNWKNYFSYRDISDNL